MAIEAKGYLKAVPACPHGSLSSRERRRRGARGSEVIDFSASCNPLGTPPGVARALAELDYCRYPDDQGMDLKEALVRNLWSHREPDPGFGPGWTALGNGSVELMWMLASAYLDPGDRAVVVGPTFGEYERACAIAGSSVWTLRASEEAGFRWEGEDLAREVAAVRPRIAFLCNPNNPTGRMVGRETVSRLLESWGDGLLVVDEAYLPFCDDPIDLMDLLASGRLLLLRSMTKDYGLAGLRLGYALAHPEIIDALNRVRPPWNVSAAAQAAGIAALEDGGFLAEARRLVRESKGFLSAGLSALGLAVIPSAANFLLVKVGDAASFRAALMERGACVRDCSSFGLPAHIRIGMRTLPECGRLLDAVKDLVTHG